MEANTKVFQDLKLFKAAFIKRFAILQSSVESIKLVMELKQISNEKVRYFYDRVFNVIMYFGRERKLEMAAANQQQGFKHYYLCLTDFVKLLFIGGTKPIIHTVLESKYNSLKDEESLLEAAVEAKVAMSALTALTDRRISQLEAEIAALRFSSSHGGAACGRGASSSRGGRGGGRGGGSSASPRFQQQSGAASADSTGLTHRQQVQLQNTWILCHKCL